MQTEIERAALAVRNAKVLVIAAGAGMGVDSGLPDFRGNEGFWKAYPPFQKLGLEFSDLANPHWFERDPHLAWGFYGHRLNLYRRTVPHAGFAILRAWGASRPHFVTTSNVDGQFQKAGFEGVSEVHGSIAHLQCTRSCSDDIWEAPPELINVDETTFRAQGELPHCPHCGELARPNILMFGDGAWISDRSDAQDAAFYRWLNTLDFARTVIVEMGAGSAIPTVRNMSERLWRHGATLVRINPRESQGPDGTISIPLGARETLERIDNLIDAV